MKEPDSLEVAIERARAQLEQLEAARAPREALAAEARELLGLVIKRRKHAQQHGVPTWEGAQRGALRMVVLASGCVALGTGAWALDPALGALSLVVSLVVLAYEGMR